ncbi:MAG TPA: hypothetical protein VNJ09_02285 [Chthonomonadales bacterium]|nr:hypothetical protein [Chthonomonadales bacterium]
MKRSLALLSGLALVALVGAIGAQETKSEDALKSGLDKGSILPAYNPRHVAGPDKGTNTCPV